MVNIENLIWLYKFLIVIYLSPDKNMYWFRSISKLKYQIICMRIFYL